MRLPCERVVNDALPIVRSLLARDLKDKGYSQTEIADLLDVTQPAVSQYLSASRGRNTEIVDPDTEQHLEELTQAVIERRPDDELSQLLHDTCITVLDEDCHNTCTPAETANVREKQ